MVSFSLSIIRKSSRLGSLFVISLIVAAAVYAVVYHEPVLLLKNFMENEVTPILFLFFMFTLPLLAVPISVFLLLVGMKFGLAPGIMVTGGAMFFHISLTYWLSRNLLHLWLDHLPSRVRQPVYKLSLLQSRWTALIFMLVPGLPYMLKNILLAQTGIGFLPYLLITWGTQFTMSIPLIMLGRAVIEMNVTILVAALVVLLSIFLLQLRIKKGEIFDEKSIKDET